MAKMMFTVGAVVGAVAGIIAGVLTAPKSGRETRADIKSKAEELKTKAAEQTDRAKAKAEDLKVRSGFGDKKG